LLSNTFSGPECPKIAGDSTPVKKVKVIMRMLAMALAHESNSSPGALYNDVEVAADWHAVS